MKELKKKLKLETKVTKKTSKKGKLKKMEAKNRKTPNKKIRAKSKINKTNPMFSHRKLEVKGLDGLMTKNIKKKKAKKFNFGSCKQIIGYMDFSKNPEKGKLKSKKLNKSKYRSGLKSVNEDIKEQFKQSKGNFFITNHKKTINGFPYDSQSSKFVKLKKTMNRMAKKSVIGKKPAKKKKAKKTKLEVKNSKKLNSKSSRVIMKSGLKKSDLKNMQQSINIDKISSVSSKEIGFDNEREKKFLKTAKEKQYKRLLNEKVHSSIGLHKVRQNIKEIFHDTSPNSWILIFQTSLDFYLIEQEIGNGSFGKVFKAIQILTNTQVALKKICKATIRLKGVEEKIQREIKILKNLNDHPNIVRLIEEFEDSDFYYLVFEYLPEGDLVTYFRRNNLFCELELKKFFYQILQGLNHIHLKGVIHRDIKPENILLDSKLSPKIADFGISTIFRKKQLITDTGGTPIYLAPEVIKAEGDVCFNTDIWSCGVLLYLLAVGDVPFKADEVQVLYAKILNDVFDITDRIDNEDVTPELGDLIGHMLIKNPRHRFSLGKCMKHPWFWPHNKNLGKVNSRRSQMDRSKSQNCSINTSKIFSKKSMHLIKSDIQESFRGQKGVSGNPSSFKNINSCKHIPFLSNNLINEKISGFQKSMHNFERQTVQKKSKTFKKTVQNFDKIFNSSTEIMNTNSRNFKSQRKIQKTKLNEEELQEIKVSVVISFLNESGFPMKYITDTVFEKDKQFTHIKSCFDQLIESL